MRRRWLLLALLTASLLVNAMGLGAAVFWYLRQGGLHNAMLRVPGLRESMGWVHPQQLRRERLASVQPRPEATVMLGDSITESGPWDVAFGDVQNHGVGGEDTRAVLARLDPILASSPRRIVLNIGNNDLGIAGNAVDPAVARLDQILSQIRRDSPATRVVVVSVLPVNPDTAPNARTRAKHANIPVYNERARRVTQDRGGVFLDLYPFFADDRGRLKPAYCTHDGVHLTGEGYALYARLLGEKLDMLQAARP